MRGPTPQEGERTSTPTARARRSAPAIALGLIGLLALASGLACRHAEPAAPETAESREARIAELERAIAEDQRALEQLITRPRDPEAAGLHEDEALRSLAERLTERRRSLRRLQARNDAP